MKQVRSLRAMPGGRKYLHDQAAAKPTEKLPPPCSFLVTFSGKIESDRRHLIERTHRLGDWLVDQRVTSELLGSLLDEHGGALALYAAQWSDCPDDCVQEALIELARQARIPACPVAWLYKVVRNRAISHFRTARRRERREQLAVRLRQGQGRAGEDPNDSFDASELAAALTSLSDELRETIVARTWGGLNFEQIAELAGCSTSTAHRRYEAGLLALRERLQSSCPTNTNKTRRIQVR